jgi:pimeloyl-ACP methyl ester carboxylesterase
VSTPPFLELPEGVRRTTVPARSGPLAALAAGDGAKGRRPVLLVPGFTGSKEDFIAVVAPLAAAGRQVVAIDQRGQYESAAADDPSAYELDALAADVLAVIDHLGAPAHLVGHSFGGLVARAAALAEPGAMASLTLMSSGPGQTPHPSASNLQLICQALPVMDLEQIWAAKRQIEISQGMPVPAPDIEDFLHRRFVGNDPAQLHRTAELLLGEPDRVDELAALPLDVLVMLGPDDDAWPPAVQREMATRLGAELAVVDGAAHSPAAEQPADTARQLLDFWHRTESA